mgnify:CR=1 FL=1
MAYKAFSNEDQQPFAVNESSNVSISEDSPCASQVHLFTGIRSLGKVNVFKVGTPPSFKDTTAKEIKYKWDFDKIILPGMRLSLSGKTYDGVFMSSADQQYVTIANRESINTHQDIFRFCQSYLYRADKTLVESGGQSSTGLISSSSAGYQTDVVREINITKELFESNLRPHSFRIQINDSNTSLTGRIDGPSAQTGYYSAAAGAVFGDQTPNVSGYTAALDIKNPFGGQVATTRKSYFGVPLRIQPDSSVNPFRYTPKTTATLDTIRTACTIEAIIKPFRTNSTIYFRRLGLTGGINAYASGAELEGLENQTKDNFMKLELVTSPDGLQPAFRFVIRSATASNMFTETFAQENTQASGLFIPNDVGIDLLDGQFHHLVASWDTSEIQDTGDQSSVDLGAGVVQGYIDGIKLANREQIFPRLASSDSGGGPVPQANMMENRIPVKQNPIAPPVTNYAAGSKFIHNANNTYVGASNYNRENGDLKGDVGPLATQFDAKLEGLFDGQIQHLRIWNQRLKDGLSGVKQNEGRQVSISAENVISGNKVEGTGALSLSFENFNHSTLTSTSASNIAAWWYFNNINGVTGSDICGSLSGASHDPAVGADAFGNMSSNTGSVVGNGKVKMFDNRNLTLGTSGNQISDAASSGIVRDFLYFDQRPNNQPVDNYITQGRLLRTGIDETLHRIGLVFYDLGLATIDGDDPNARLNWTYPASGVTGDMGFGVTGHLNTSFNFQRVVFDQQVDKARLLLDATASGGEMNFAGNPTGYSQETEEPVFDDPTTYVTSVGLYNHHNDLLAVAKLAKPVRKDDTVNLTTQIKLDF